MAGALSIALALTATGVTGVQSAFSTVSRAVNGMTQDIEDANKRTEELRKALERARSGGASVQEIAQRTADLDAHLNSAAGQAAQLQQRLSGMRDAGVGIAGAGLGAMALANSLAQGAEEGNAIQARLESILEAQHRIQDAGKLGDIITDVTVRAHLDDDDTAAEAVVQMLSDQVATADVPGLLEAAARNAEALKQPLDQVGTLFAKAYAEGNLSRLKRANILFSEQEEESVKAAFAISETAGRMKFMEVVTAATARSTGELGSGLTDAQKAANDLAREGNAIKDAVGTGAAEAKKGVDNLLGSVLAVVGANKEVAQTAGGVLYVGGVFAAMGGTALATAAQIGLVASTFPAMQAAAITAWAAVSGGAAAAGIALLPLIGIIAAIAAAMVALTAVAVWLENKQYEANIAAGDATDDKRLELANKHRETLGQKSLTMAEYKASEADEPDSSAPPDMAALQKQIEGLKNMAQAPASVPASLPATSAGVAATPTAPSVTATIAVGDASTPSSSTSGPGSSIEEMQERMMLSTSKTEKAELKKQLFYAKRAAAGDKTAQAERDKYEKALKKQHDQQAKLEEKRAAALEDSALDVRQAEIEEFYSTKIAELEAHASEDDTARTNYAKAMLEAERTEALGSLNRGPEDDIAGDKKSRLAAIKAKGIRDRAALSFEKDSREEEEKDGSSKKDKATSTMAWLRRGGSIFDIDKASQAKGASTSRPEGAPASPDTKMTVRGAGRVVQRAGRRVIEIIVPPIPLDEGPSDGLLQELGLV